MKDSSAHRVVIVDRHRLFADCLCVALTEGGLRCHVTVPHPRSTVNQLVGDIRRERPGVVVMDSDPSPAWDGLDLIAPLSRIGAEVVVVTEDTDTTRTRDALLRGARSVLPKKSSLSAFQVVLRQAATGEASPPNHSQAAVPETQNALHEDGPRTRLQQLTSRENEVLGLLMEGNTVNEIARLNVVSEATVRTQVRNVLNKLEVSSQLAAVGVARKAEWQRRPHLGWED